MKKFTSIKTRITIWYTALMFIMVSVVLAIVGSLSYQLSIYGIENDIKAQVSQVSQRVRDRASKNIFYSVESNKEFKNVSIYLEDGSYVVGQYLYDLSSIPFREKMRRETVDGETYIVYDEFKPSKPGDNRGYWIRGAESVNYTKVLGRSMFMIILIIIPIILLITAFGGYYITRKAFLPVNDITHTANEICTQNDIKKRIPINPYGREDELYKLSLTLNKMLDKIEDLIVKEKQFTSDASHELRTPISVILAQGEYLLDIADNEKEKELAKSIVDKSNQVSKLVSRLLLLARIDSNRQKINKEKVDLSVLVDIAADGMRELAKSKNIVILTDVSENTIVNADEALLLSAISNLISNAIKYGRESGHVIIKASKYADSTEIVVSDNGIGISSENLEKIWGRFYRVDDVRNDEYGSSGLGLSMVKSIVELHNGKIFVKSQLGKGTEFRIVL